MDYELPACEKNVARPEEDIPARFLIDNMRKSGFSDAQIIDRFYKLENYM